MLREKSGNSSITKWLDNTKHSKETNSTAPSTMGIGQGLENYQAKEELDLQQAIKQSRKDYMKQQKQHYTTLSSLYSTQKSTSESTYTLPSIDDDDAWFQSSPTSPSRSAKRSKLSLSTKRTSSNLSSPKRKAAQVDINSGSIQLPTNGRSTSTLSSQKQASQSPYKDDDWRIETTVEPIKEEDESWTIQEDESWTIQEDEPWEIHSSQKTKIEEDSWEINETEETSNATPPDDDMNEYLSAIRNRSTKKATASSLSLQPAPLLDDVFQVIGQNQDSLRQTKKSRSFNAETDPAYNPPKIYQTHFDTTRTNRQATPESDMEDDDSDCSSIIDLCMENERERDDDISSLFEDDDPLPCADDLEDDIYEDSFDTTVNDQHPFEIDDDDTPPLQFEDRNINPPIDNQPWIDEHDSGYLSPLEGFVSLLDQPAFNYKPYFDQLTASASIPSRTPARPPKRPTRRRVFIRKRYK